jgi:hypothetical protein
VDVDLGLNPARGYQVQGRSVNRLRLGSGLQSLQHVFFSILFLVQVLHANHNKPRPSDEVIRRDRIFYVLNPDKNLSKTQATSHCTRKLKNDLINKLFVDSYVTQFFYFFYFFIFLDESIGQKN